MSVELPFPLPVGFGLAGLVPLFGFTPITFMSFDEVLFNLLLSTFIGELLPFTADLWHFFFCLLPVHANAGFTLSLGTTNVPFLNFVEGVSDSFGGFGSDLGWLVLGFVSVLFVESAGFDGAVFGVDCWESAGFISG